MDPRPLPWALVLLSSALVVTLGRAPTPEGPEKLCGHHFVRALVRVCGGPRWSPEAGRPVAGGDREWAGGGRVPGFLSGHGAPVGFGARAGWYARGRPGSTCRALAGASPEQRMLSPLGGNRRGA